MMIFRVPVQRTFRLNKIKISVVKNTCKYVLVCHTDLRKNRKSIKYRRDRI